MRFSQFIWFIALVTSILPYHVLAKGGNGGASNSTDMGSMDGGNSSSNSTAGAGAGAAAPAKKKKGPAEPYGTSCYNAAGKFNFGCPILSPADLATNMTKCLCQNEAYIETVVGCINQNAKNKTLEKNGYKTLQSICTKSDWDYSAISKNLGTLPSLSNEKDFTTLQSSAFAIPKSLFNHEMAIMNQGTTGKNRDARFAGAVLAYWGGVFFLRAITSLCFIIFPKILLKFDTPFIRKLRQKVLLPPSGRYHHSTTKKAGTFTFSIPLRSETLTIIGYTVLNFILCFAKNDYYFDSYSNPSVQSQWSKELGNRSGQLVVSQLMLSILFGGRNNFLIWLTNWPLSTFNVFHKWVSRVMVATLIVHALAMTVNVVGTPGSYLKHWHSGYFIWGTVASIIMGILITHSAHYFRSMSYEIFLVTHIILAALGLAGAWLHVAHPKTGFPYIYAACAVWCFDRFFRWVRIIWSGVNSKADVTLHEGGVIEYKIDYSKRWKYYPGSYAFIHVLRPNCFWQSHPFTLTTSPKPEDDGKLVLYTRVKKGFTEKTRDYLLTQPNHTARLPILLEGPYGHHHPVQHYETVVLIAGGIGITGVYPYADELRRHADKKQKLILVWAIADERPLEWFSDQLEHLSKDARIDLQIHVGNIESSSSSVVDLSTSNSTEEKEKDVEQTKKVSAPSMIPRACGRPEVDSVVEKTIAESTKSIAFICCGPHSMNDDTRRAISNRLDSTSVRMDYFEESFGW